MNFFKKRNTKTNFSTKMVVGWKFLVIRLLKFDHFWKSYIYSERGNLDASSCTKNLISIFFRKIEFSEGGDLDRKFLSTMSIEEKDILTQIIREIRI